MDHLANENSQTDSQDKSRIKVTESRSQMEGKTSLGHVGRSVGSSRGTETITCTGNACSRIVVGGRGPRPPPTGGGPLSTL